jgi:glycosyltransferase involved in cell wall biosynthesis
VSTGSVGLNLMWLVPGVVGGSEEYTTRLLGALADHPIPDVEFTLYANGLLPGTYPDLADHYEIVLAPVSGRQKSMRVAAESSWMAWHGRRRGLDLMHHLGGIMPFARTVPGMVTVHDLQPLVMPEHFTTLKRTFGRLSIPPSARHAHRIVTLTEVTRTMLIERLGVAPDRVVVIPAGVTPPSKETLAAEEATDVRARYGLEGRPLFLYPAITYPHKNHLFLLDAFARVVEQRDDALLLLTAGPAQMEGRVMEAVRSLGIWRNVNRLGRIPRIDIDALYHEAVALVFPSKFEGFGIPVLEAMTRGCPVVAADATALPEVAGEAATLLPLDDPQPWADEMLRLLDDETHRQRLSAAGIERAASFDWASVATSLSGVYQEVLSEL